MKRLLTLTTILAAGTAYADAPNVATDIAPVHSLVSMVMDGVGTPDLIMPVGASPHSYSMRPSEARSLEQADVVFWVGEDLTPWLEGPMDTLAADAIKLELLTAHGVELLDFREDAIFGDHEDHHDDHDDHGHDDHKDEHAEHDNHDHDEKHEEHGHEDKHDDHDHAEKHDDHDHDKEHDDHGHEEKHADHDDHHDDHKDEHAGHDDHGHEGHNHGEHDPHAWLDPHIAETWLGEIAEVLAEADPANAATYEANAEKYAAELDELAHELEEKLEAVHEKEFVVFHDAYQYFEEAFNLHSAGALQLGDASTPSAARLAELKAEIEEHDIACVFAEPQFNPNIIQAVAAQDIKVGELDPLGFGLDTGIGFYPALLNKLADSAIDCLK